MKGFQAYGHKTAARLAFHVLDWNEEQTNEFVNSIVNAKRNLKYSSLRIKEIASNLGFNDTSYFIRYFKRYVGISPIDFRNQQKNY